MKTFALLLSLLLPLAFSQACAEAELDIYKMTVTFGEHTYTDIMTITPSTRQIHQGKQEQTYQGTFTVPGNFTVKIAPQFITQANTTRISFVLNAEEGGNPFSMLFVADATTSSGITTLADGVISDNASGKKMGTFSGVQLQ